ncbi:acyltransferase [Lonepinella koalarum]|uniref:Transferase family hexapeptide repeat protein n=1 Tax=Lonepinella koalarum TaxID=53417 RepID=A0A4R1L0X1_9PAST|nr:acyltransferase [Lonepinella koalarum]MDH2926802.1 hypothetical protein [Lonepinella koalarum]TCK70540.1 transferase family hexapeptide repeat protein [Lonepinella koalarum]TFJ90080.1 acyltransferase [Lonepinella koalarum]
MHFIFKILKKIISVIRSLKFYCYVKICGGKIIGLPRVGEKVIWKYPPHSGISIGKNFDIGHNCFLEVPKGANLNIGDNVKLTHSVTISCLNYIEIGNDTLIAEFCSIRDSTHNIKLNSLIRHQQAIKGMIKIGNDVWVGRNTSIFNDVTINDGCVIGANSLCSKNSYVKNTINVGIPCSYLKNRI